MLFNSFQFIVFFIVVLLLHYMLPHKLRWIMLLAASCIFYAVWSPIFFLLFFAVVFINYFFYTRIDSMPVSRTRAKKITLAACAFMSFGILFVFKYLVFINHSLMYLFARSDMAYPLPDFKIILPLGISFYTFQAFGYTMDVYRRQLEPEKNFFKFFLFVTFFPQLVAGPIERASNLMPQIFEEKKFSLDNIIIGSKYMALGFFKKVVIADRVSVAVNTVYNSPQNYEGLYFLIATFLFAFQIYCDFSGYSDIALGLAKTLGIDLMNNFRQPYLSKSIQEFWRRWHISLSTWFKDYLYIPLGGSRVGKFKFYRNTMITFMVSGIWHGANWTFVIWGALHGVYQVIGSMLDKNSEKNHGKKHDKKKDFFLIRWVRVLVTFLFVCFAWIFFRANQVSDAFFIVRNLFTGVENWTSLQYVFDCVNDLGLSFLEFLLCIGAIGFLTASEIFSGEKIVHSALMKLPFPIRYAYYLIIVAALAAVGVFYNAGEFIYFQF